MACDAYPPFNVTIWNVPHVLVPLEKLRGHSLISSFSGFNEIDCAISKNSRTCQLDGVTLNVNLNTKNTLK